MIETLYTLAVILMGFIYWLGGKTLDAFPEEFSVTRFLKENKDMGAIGPDPSSDQVRSRLIRRNRQLQQNKSKLQGTCEEMVADTGKNGYSNVKK